MNFCGAFLRVYCGTILFSPIIPGRDVVLVYEFRVRNISNFVYSFCFFFPSVPTIKSLHTLHDDIRSVNGLLY